MIEVVHGDCLDGLAGMEAGSVDMIFADPPFNIGKGYGEYRDNLDDGEYMDWCFRWLGECVRVMSGTGSLFLYNIPRILVRQTEWLNERLTFEHWIAWDSSSNPFRSRLLLPAHYGILFYSKGDPKFYDVRAPHDRCRNCGGYARNYGGKEGVRHDFGRLVSDVWNDIPRIRNRENKIAGHPCHLPVPLLERLLLLTTDPGDLFVEPFAGVGAGAVAAKRLGRRYLGWEIDGRYAEAARKRVAETAETRRLGGAYVSEYKGAVMSVRDCDLEEI